MSHKTQIGKAYFIMLHNMVYVKDKYLGKTHCLFHH